MVESLISAELRSQYDISEGHPCSDQLIILNSLGCRKPDSQPLLRSIFIAVLIATVSVLASKKAGTSQFIE